MYYSSIVFYSYEYIYTIAKRLTEVNLFLMALIINH
ncbi:hypothetical protein ACQ27_gp343 [Klebsiella phage K64-1]|nr:hypothetical protein ACQ27_gp343 [Klebsiella phage K64-1]